MQLLMRKTIIVQSKCASLSMKKFNMLPYKSSSYNSKLVINTYISLNDSIRSIRQGLVRKKVSEYMILMVIKLVCKLRT